MGTPSGSTVKTAMPKMWGFYGIITLFIVSGCDSKQASESSADSGTVPSGGQSIDAAISDTEQDTGNRSTESSTEEAPSSEEKSSTEEAPSPEETEEVTLFSDNGSDTKETTSETIDTETTEIEIASDAGALDTGSDTDPFGSDSTTREDGGIDTDTGDTGTVQLDSGSNSDDPCDPERQYPYTELSPEEELDGRAFLHLFFPPARICDPADVALYLASPRAELFVLYIWETTIEWVDEMCLNSCADMGDYETCVKGSCTLSDGAMFDYQKTRLITESESPFGFTVSDETIEERVTVILPEDFERWRKMEIIKRTSTFEKDIEIVDIEESYDIAWEGELDPLLPESADFSWHLLRETEDGITERREESWRTPAVSSRLVWSEQAMTETVTLYFPEETYVCDDDGCQIALAYSESDLHVTTLLDAFND